MTFKYTGNDDTATVVSQNTDILAITNMVDGSGEGPVALVPVHTGETKVVVTIPESSNYHEASGEFSVTVNPRSATNFVVTLSGDTYTYDGTAKTPEVIVKDGETPLTYNVDYTYSFSGEHVVAGTHTVVVTGINNYTGTKLATFEILKAPRTITMANEMTIRYKQEDISSIDFYPIH